MADYAAGFYKERMYVSGTVCFALLFSKTLWCTGIMDLPTLMFVETGKLQVVYYALNDNLLPNLVTKFPRDYYEDKENICK